MLYLCLPRHLFLLLISLQEELKICASTWHGSHFIISNLTLYFLNCRCLPNRYNYLYDVYARHGNLNWFLCPCDESVETNCFGLTSYSMFILRCFICVGHGDYKYISFPCNKELKLMFMFLPTLESKHWPQVESYYRSCTFFMHFFHHKCFHLY